MARIVIEIIDLPGGDLTVQMSAYAATSEQTAAATSATFAARLGRTLLDLASHWEGRRVVHNLGEFLLDRCPDGCDCTADCGDDPRIGRDEWGRKKLLPEGDRR